MTKKPSGRFKPIVAWGRRFTFREVERNVLSGYIPASTPDQVVERVEDAVGDYLTDLDIKAMVPSAADVRAACDELADHALWLTQRVRWADAATRAGITTALLYHVRTPVSDPGAFLDRLRHDLALLHEAAIRAKTTSPKGRSGRRPEEARRRLARRVAAAWRDIVGPPATTGTFPTCLRVVLEAVAAHLGEPVPADIRPIVKQAIEDSQPPVL